MTQRGALHVHSTWSDGELSLGELRERFIAAGCTFACLTDHAEYFSTETLREYEAACAASSDARFTFVPGLEYRCDPNVHVLGFGALTSVGSTDVADAIDAIVAAGGVAVIAHPTDLACASLAQLSRVPTGIEVWNTKFDGRYAPRCSPEELLSALRDRKRDCWAFYGQDLHWAAQASVLWVDVDAPTSTRGDLLAALRRGDFVGRCGSHVFGSDGQAVRDRARRFAAVQHACGIARRALGRGARWLRAVGMPVPRPLVDRVRSVW